MTVTIGVEIFYEDWETGVRAKQVLDQLEQQFEPETEFVLGLWRFDLLEEPIWHEQAVKAASEADIILVSLHGHRALPEAIFRWLHQWLVQKLKEPTALVISLDSSAKELAATNQFLSALGELAKPAGVDLFTHSGHVDYPRSEPTLKTLLLPHIARDNGLGRHPH
ncbi:MAG TPA: hypothetical protein VNZ22_03770 [Bacillota bacterium]|nr:hypothetical protein [Bacillota bacterium]